MKIIETRTINFNDIRNLCIKQDWYTRGTNEEYGNMLDYATSNEMTTEKLIVVAEDIIAHSAPRCFADCEPNGTTPIQYVLFELCEICHSFFHDEEADYMHGNKAELDKLNNNGKHGANPIHMCF